MHTSCKYMLKKKAYATIDPKNTKFIIVIQSSLNYKHPKV